MMTAPAAAGSRSPGSESAQRARASPISPAAASPSTAVAHSPAAIARSLHRTGRARCRAVPACATASAAAILTSPATSPLRDRRIRAAAPAAAQGRAAPPR
ncbi:hypothetical protein ACFQXA_35395 [Nocardiopsis composta]